MSEVFYTVEDEVAEWGEISRVEALERLEKMLTEDIVAFEIDPVSDDTAVGNLHTYTWLRVTDDDDQQPVLLALRDPVHPDAPMRWFVHSDLVGD